MSDITDLPDRPDTLDAAARRDAPSPALRSRSLGAAAHDGPARMVTQ